MTSRRVEERRSPDLAPLRAMERARNRATESRPRAAGYANHSGGAR